MLYTRGEIVDLVRDIAPELDSLLVAIIWFASRCNSNLIDSDRYGLLQVDVKQARTAGFHGDANELLDPATNIRIAAGLIHTRGLIEFCGRALASQLPAILRLESELKARAVDRNEANQSAVQR